MKPNFLTTVKAFRPSDVAACSKRHRGGFQNHRVQVFKSKADVLTLARQYKAESGATFVDGERVR